MNPSFSSESREGKRVRYHLTVRLTPDLHLTDKDAQLMLHPAPDGEAVAGLVRLHQRHLVDPPPLPPPHRDGWSWGHGAAWNEQ